jgi:hypothetical protein
MVERSTPRTGYRRFRNRRYPTPRRARGHRAASRARRRDAERTSYLKNLRPAFPPILAIDALNLAPPGAAPWTFAVQRVISCREGCAPGVSVPLQTGNRPHGAGSRKRR